jgi:hypothetical protein
VEIYISPHTIGTMMSLCLIAARIHQEVEGSALCTIPSIIGNCVHTGFFAQGIGPYYKHHAPMRISFLSLLTNCCSRIVRLYYASGHLGSLWRYCMYTHYVD